MRFPVLQEVESYWDALRGDHAIPFRADVDPRKIEKALRSAFILERLAPGIARFRLAGSHLTELMGMEIRGMPLTTLYMPEARDRVSSALEQVFSTPAKAWLTLAGDRGLGKPPLDACMMLLPLKSDQGEITRALGCLASLGPVGRTPRRFVVRTAAVTPILPNGSMAVPDMTPETWQTPAAATPPHEVVNGFQEPAVGFNPSPHRPERTDKPQLYLVKSDD